MAVTLFDIQKKYGERVYIIYKEAMHPPYMEGKNGIGIQGALLTDGEKVMCDLCEEWFHSIAKHISRAHKISSQEYRQERGLGARSPICSPATSKKYRDHAIKKMAKQKNRDQLKNIKRVPKITGSEAVTKGYKTMQYRNNFGLCPEQMALRYVILAIEKGRFPDEYSIRDLDRFLWTNIDKFYGSFPAFYKEIGINPKDTKYEIP